MCMVSYYSINSMLSYFLMSTGYLQQIEGKHPVVFTTSSKKECDTKESLFIIPLLPRASGYFRIGKKRMCSIVSTIITITLLGKSSRVQADRAY